MSEKRKPVKESTMSRFEPAIEATALSLTSPPSQGTFGQSDAKSKEQSIPRQQKKDEKNKSSPTTNTRDKSAAHTGPQYLNTSNQGLSNTSAISDIPTSPASLTNPITSQDVYSSLSTVPANHTSNSSHKSCTSPQPSLQCDTQPPKIHRPNEVHVPSNWNSKGPELDSCVPLYHDTFFHSPQRSGDFHHSGIFQYGEDEMKKPLQCASMRGEDETTKPQQCASMEVATKLLPSDYTSMQIDGIGFSKTSEASTDVLRQYSKVSSSDSDCTDKMIGLEGSIPIGLIMGQSTPTDSLVYNLREEIDRLRKQLEERENKIKILTETSVNMYKLTTNNVDPVDEPRDGSMPSFGGLSNGEDLQAGGGDTCKMVGLMISMKTNDKGVPLIKGQRQSRQEQDLNKKLVSLEAQLALMQSEVDSLNDQNIRKQETINSLQANVRTNEGNTDINGYLDKIVELTTRLTDIEEEEKKQRLKNAELELQLSKSKTLAQFVKQLSTQRDQLTSEVKQLTAALEEEKTRQPLSVDSIQVASLTDDKLHLRVLTEEAVKVPELQREIIDLKKKAESFEEVAKQCSDQLLDKVTELRNSEEEIKKLTDELQHHQENQAADISDHTAITESEEYQILLQDVMAKDEQLQQLKDVTAHRQKLQMDLELQATELKMKTEQADKKTAELEAKKTELAKTVEELRRIQAQFELSEKLNKKLRERVVATTSPVPVPRTKLKTEHPQQSGDTERRFSKACKTIYELNGKIAEMESTIQKLNLDNGNMAADIQKRQSQIDKLVTDHQGVLDYSKKQSQTIADLNSQLEALQESHQNSEQIEANRKEKSAELESRLNWLESQNAQLNQELNGLKRLGGDTSAVVQALQEESQAMHADLDRIRTERNELRQRAGQLEELDKKYNHSQQKIISQQALLENKQKELDDLRRDMPPLKVAIQKHRTELIHISKQRDEAKSELNLSKQTMQIYEDDFRSEREDREKAHSKIAEIETRYVKKLESMTNELQTKARELQVAVTTHSELKARYNAEVTQLKFDLREKNNQIHHYGQKAQVESTVPQTDRFERENKKLTYDNQQLIGHLRQLEATQSQFRRLQEERLQSIDDLTMKNTMLLSELEALKKKGVVSL